MAGLGGASLGGARQEPAFFKLRFERAVSCSENRVKQRYTQRIYVRIKVRIR
jgi:hypothetical protein